MTLAQPGETSHREPFPPGSRSGYCAGIRRPGGQVNGASHYAKAEKILSEIETVPAISNETETALSVRALAHAMLATPRRWRSATPPWNGARGWTSRAASSRSARAARRATATASHGAPVRASGFRPPSGSQLRPGRRGRQDGQGCLMQLTGRSAGGAGDARAHPGGSSRHLP